MASYMCFRSFGEDGTLGSGEKTGRVQVYPHRELTEAQNTFLDCIEDGLEAIVELDLFASKANKYALLSGGHLYFDNGSVEAWDYEPRVVNIWTS